MSKGFDTPADASTMAAAIKAAGFSWVAMYYFASSAFKKLLTQERAQKLSDAGLYVVAVYENGFPTTPGYFTGLKGRQDAASAIQRATQAGQPHGTPIYFAVDADISPSVVEPYFKEVHAAIKAAGYLTGVYGSGAVCEHLVNGGYVTHTWLSQSHGFPGYQRWLPHANIVQGPSGKFHGMDVDWDEATALGGGGWKLPAG